MLTIFYFSDWKVLFSVCSVIIRVGACTGYEHSENDTTWI